MQFDSYTQASRWLDLTTFGSQPGEVNSLVNERARTWFDDQVSLSSTSHLQQIKKQFSAQGYGKVASRSTRIRAWLDIAFYAKDQLRQRVAYALSQIFVVSDQDATLINQASGLAHYNDLLCEHAFGNYRDLLRAVSVSPVMGHYLTMVGNKKGDPLTGRRPDENYAREILQLFSMGLYERELDGSYVLDAEGNTIPCYSEKDIQELARIFTGWKHADFFEPMENDEQDHDIEEKEVLKQTFYANTSAGVEMDQVVELLLQHPSTAPNICKGLIQKLVTSNPSPHYVRRVSEIFRDNGEGVMGDLKAVIWAIFSDQEVYSAASETMSKVREPWLSLVKVYRTLDVKPGGDSALVESSLGYLKTCNQYPLGAPSVFNFYLPDYAPKGVVKDKGLVAPELQIIDWAHIIYLHNAIYGLLRLNLQDLDKPLKEQLYINVEALKAHIVDKDIEGFIQEVAERFFNGVMPEPLQSLIKDHYNGLEINPGKWVQRLLFLALTSPYFHVQENRA